MIRRILKRLPATLPSKYPRFVEVGHPHFLGGSTISWRARAACAVLMGVKNSNLRNGGRKNSISRSGSKSDPAIRSASNIGKSRHSYRNGSTALKHEGPTRGGA